MKTKRVPNKILPHSTDILTFKIIAEIEASEFFYDESTNWQYCKEFAVFSHIDACEFIFPCVSNGGDDSISITRSEKMKKYGCTIPFIDAYLHASAMGANWILFYV